MTVNLDSVPWVLAHQYLGQLDPKLQEALAANSSIKFAGGVSAKDARALAPMMSCAPELIEAQQKGSFAAYVRGVTKSAVPLKFPLGHMEAMPQMTASEFTELRTAMRDAYAVHYSELNVARSKAPEHTEGSSSKPQPPKPSPQPPDRTEPDASDDRAKPDW